MTSIPAKKDIAANATSDLATSLWKGVRRVLDAIRVQCGRAARAHDLRQASEAVGPETMRDTGMDPETASGIPAWQPDLPFFMQSGFGRR